MGQQLYGDRVVLDSTIYPKEVSRELEVLILAHPKEVCPQCVFYQHDCRTFQPQSEGRSGRTSS
jgi:hypothetical protein